MPESRRHIAVMFTDIVGYTALMGSDEDKAFDMLKRNHTIHATLIRKYNGKLIKEIGDGTLASFPLASDAVRCAMDIQIEAKSQNIPLKIGIHQGEMVMAGGDVLGDGVNVASRLQESAEEGCVSISGAVYRDVKNKAGITAEYLEDKTFKNVDEPVKVYKVHCEEKEEVQEALPEKSSNKRYYYIIAGLAVVIVGILIWQFLPTKKTVTEETNIVDKSIAVLPFKDLSAEMNNQYFCDGVMEGILNNLSKIKDLRVVGRTSSEKYRETSLLIPKIAEELNVSYLLEASVFKSDDRIRVTAQLINARKDEHIWSEQYDRELKDVFDVMSDISQEVASEVKVVVSSEVKERINSKPTKNLEAYNLYLQGRYFWNQRSSDALDKSIEFFNQALEVDPNYALAYSGMAATYVQYAWTGYAPRRVVVPKAKKAAMKAIELDSTLGEAHAELAFARFIYDLDWSGSEMGFKRALELNPNYAYAHWGYAWLLTYIGRFEEAIQEAKISHELDPLDVNLWSNYGRIYYYARNYDRAIEVYRKILRVYPDNTYTRILLALALVHNDNHQEAIKECQKLESKKLIRYEIGYVYGIVGENEKAEEILDYFLERSKYEFVHYANIFFIYAALNNNDEAFKWLERTYDELEAYIGLLKVEPMFDNLRSDSRFDKFIDRMNFPD